MALIPIKPTACINPQYVQSVVCKYDAGYVAVRMYDGDVHDIQPIHNESPWQTYDRVRRELGCEAKQ